MREIKITINDDNSLAIKGPLSTEIDRIMCIRVLAKVIDTIVSQPAKKIVVPDSPGEGGLC